MFDFSQYEPGFREYQKQNPLGLEGVGLMVQELPGGLRLNDTGEIKQFSDYMQSIGADDYYNQYSRSRGGLLPAGVDNFDDWDGVQSIGGNARIPSAQPIKKMFDFSQYEPGFREYLKQNNRSGGGKQISTLPGGFDLAGSFGLPGGLMLANTGEADAFEDYMQSIGAGDYYNQYMNMNTFLATGFPSETPTISTTPPVQPSASIPQATTVPSVGLQTAQPSANISSTGNSNMATDTTTTTSGLSEFAQPYAEYGLAEALRQYQAGAPAYFPGQTYTEFAPQTEQALRAAEQRALAGSPLVSGAQEFAQTAMAGGFGSPAMQYAQGLAGGVDLSEPMGMVRQTAQGGFLGGSPGLQAAIERATRPAQASAMSSLASRGRLGSGLGSQAVAQTVGDIAANISYQDYNRERQNQIAAQQTLAEMMRAQYGSALQGAGFLGDVYQQDYARRAGAASAAPGLAELDYGDISRLANVGAAREAQAQRAIEDAMARYQYEQTAPQQQLGQYLSSVYGFPGQQQTTVTPLYEPSRGQQFLGGAAAFGSLYGENAGFSDRLPGMLLGGLLANV